MTVADWIWIGTIASSVLWLLVNVIVIDIQTKRWNRHHACLDRIRELEEALLNDANKHPWDQWPRMPDWVKEQRKK